MSKVSVKATSTFTAFDDGAMVVANAGDTVELTEAAAQNYIDCGLASLAKGKGKKPVKADEPVSEPDLGEPDAGDEAGEGEGEPDADAGADSAP
jgi:hypothetical protein